MTQRLKSWPWSTPLDLLVDAEWNDLPEPPIPFDVARWLSDARRAMPPTPEVERWLANAICNWLLRPPPVGHRPKETRYQKLVKNFLVAGCLGLIRAGMSPKTAAEKISRVADRVKLRRPGGKPITAATMYGWWRQLRSTPGPQFWAEAICEDETDPSMVIGAIKKALEDLLGNERHPSVRGEKEPLISPPDSVYARSSDIRLTPLGYRRDRWSKEFSRRNRIAQRFMRRPEVEKVTGLPRSTLYEKIAAGKFPKPVPLGARSVGWPEAEVIDWQEERLAEREAVRRQTRLK